MHVESVGLCAPGETRISVTPEQLAALGARYSRNGGGLQKILDISGYPFADEAATERILANLDYGHASIADMAPVAIFMDEISLFAAYTLWAQSPQAGGQECSTRYIEFKEGDNFAADYGIGDVDSNYADFFKTSFKQYAIAQRCWTELATKHPKIVKLPEGFKGDEKKIDRIKRNFVFDRTRYFLPFGAKTNVFIVQSARAWITLCRYLISSLYIELNNLGARIKEQLELCAPNLAKYARFDQSYFEGASLEFNTLCKSLKNMPYQHYIDGKVSYKLTQNVIGDHTNYLHAHDSRYSYVGPAARMDSVFFGWSKIAIAELRDLNRHRTGNKFTELVPRGFYGAYEEFTEAHINNGLQFAHLQNDYHESVMTMRDHSAEAFRLLKTGSVVYSYFMNLGTQVGFYHTTTLDKFIYELELRTGFGAHYKYSQHMMDVFEIAKSSLHSVVERIIIGKDIN